MLPGGLRVITEALPSVRSATFGIWVGVGSRDESTAQAGSAHYLEHLLFKGTPRRDALEISSAIDAVGGEINAFTSKEYTCYYARVLDRDLPLAVDVICDMVTSALVNPTDVDAERGVILEEIAMHDDDPSDVVHDEFARGVFGNGPLGRPILGSVGHDRSGCRDARSRPTTGGTTGPTTWSSPPPATSTTPRSSGWSRARSSRCWAGIGEPRSPRRAGRSAIPHRLAGARDPTDRAGEPGARRAGVSRTDDRRFALGVLNTALGGGMSSRLFQEIREKRGLAYSVYSFSSRYADTGLFGVYAGCLPAKVDQVLELARAELQKVVDDGLTDEELARGKGQIRGSIVLGLEDTGSRMTRLGKAELVHGELLGVDEVLARIDAVTLDDVRSIAREVLGATPTLAVIGPFDDRIGWPPPSPESTTGRIALASMKCLPSACARIEPCRVPRSGLWARRAGWAPRSAAPSRRRRPRAGRGRRRRRRPVGRWSTRAPRSPSTSPPRTP